MNNNDQEKAIKMAANWIANSKHLVIFTGAGISTESGIPDYRGPNGVWTRKDKGMPPPKMEKNWNEVEPNLAHYGIYELQEMGKLAFLISQNVDNLHLKSGIRPELIAELHGNRTLMRCLGCDRQMTYKKAGWDKRIWDNGYLSYPEKPNQPKCPYCKGRLISSVVNFGDPLPEKVLKDSFDHSKKSDVFFIIGSSLVVTPAANLPEIALRNDAKVILLNKGTTPFDDYVQLRIYRNAGEFISKIVQKVKEILK